ncbi:MAG: site-specific DNA-methyltransferase [Undibacterium sp.]|uniref:site-specific DNA-methyltransferase n=1 Tax=Undibacterium sp. TaxID=1914977 RepID=UPI00271A986F|nr:site-specific DNA-methyltransferase [Undibacterium sp.]MDO8651232.1 site-specific DNA-methyltransferase [Undibacterium sp.]
MNQQYRFNAPADKPANSTNNRIIHGDNLEVLKSLLPEFEGKVNCIYIDPPYNTGNEGWVYNDAVNDPKIKKWLGQVVGKEGEDLSRHDKWLCMMYPRLKLLQRLLAKDGLIFVSLDDVEAAHTRVLLDEIFGYGNFLTAIAWEKRYTRSNNAKLFYSLKDTILVYRKSTAVSELKEGRTEKADANYSNPNNDERGLWMTSSYVNPALKEKRPNLSYLILNPSNQIIEHPTHAWKYSQEEHERHKSEDRLWWGQDGEASYPRLKLFLDEASGMVPVDLWSYQETGTTDEGGFEIKEIFGSAIFDTPKPTRLIERILKIATDENSIILDSFAGSGTTAHAVLKLNSQDNGNRRFILVETMDYAETITAERVRRVMNGYGDGSKTVAGLGGSFDFYNVGEALFLPDENLNEAVGIAAIRDYVAYTEGIPESDRCAQDNPYLPHLLGLNTEMAWIFNYETDSVTVLDLNYLAGIKLGAAKPATAIIYADRCLLDEAFMRQHGISFKKIPRDITRF